MKRPTARRFLDMSENTFRRDVEPKVTPYFFGSSRQPRFARDELVQFAATCRDSGPDEDRLVRKAAAMARATG